MIEAIEIMKGKIKATIMINKEIMNKIEIIIKAEIITINRVKIVITKMCNKEEIVISKITIIMMKIVLIMIILLKDLQNPTKNKNQEVNQNQNNKTIKMMVTIKFNQMSFLLIFQ